MGNQIKKQEQKSNENSMREKKSQGGEQEDTGLQQDYDSEEIKKIYGRIKNGQKMREPVFILNFWMVLLLSIVTGGIYLLYAEYRLNKDVDIISIMMAGKSKLFEAGNFKLSDIRHIWRILVLPSGTEGYEASDGTE